MIEGKEHRLKIREVYYLSDLAGSCQTLWNHRSLSSQDELNELKSSSGSLPPVHNVWTTCVYIFDWGAAKCCVIKSIWRAQFNLRVSFRGLTSSSRLQMRFISGMETQIQYGPLLLQIAFWTIAAEGKLANNTLCPLRLSDDRGIRRTNPSQAGQIPASGLIFLEHTIRQISNGST